MTETPTLQQFLLVRFEAIIQALDKAIEDLRVSLGPDMTDKELADHPNVLSLMREHTQVFALRQIVLMHDQGKEDWAHVCALCGIEGQDIDCTYPCDTLRLLAMAYIGTPDFNPDWAIRPEYFERQALLSSKDFQDGLEDYLMGRVSKA